MVNAPKGQESTADRLALRRGRVFDVREVADPETDPILRETIEAMRDHPGPVCVLVGDGSLGADQSALLARVEPLRRWKGTLIGGATDQGVSDAVGNIVADAEADGHLLGIGLVPYDAVRRIRVGEKDAGPWHTDTSGETPVHGGYDRVLRVQSAESGVECDWGGEVPLRGAMLAAVRRGRKMDNGKIDDKTRKNVVFIAHGGGGITEREVLTALQENYPVILLAGSGRRTDALLEREDIRNHPNVYVAHDTVELEYLLEQVQHADPGVVNEWIKKGVKGWADPLVPDRLPRPEGETVQHFLNRIRYSESGELRFDENGRIENPWEEGLPDERGRLGVFGPNHACDPLPFRVSPDGGLEILLIIRDDAEGDIDDAIDVVDLETMDLDSRIRFAYAGGMVEIDRSKPYPSGAERDRKHRDTAGREVSEEIKFIDTATGAPRRDINKACSRAFATAESVWDGYAKNDPRNSRRLWIENHGYMIVMPYDPTVRPKGASDARRACWVKVSPKLINRMYANHGDMLLRALAKKWNTGIGGCDLKRQFGSNPEITQRIAEIRVRMQQEEMLRRAREMMT